MKQPPPQYPRPVPDLDLDEAPILPGTIVYAERCCDAEDILNSSEEYRASKRRRIESAAHAYLRGEELIILSAGLKGPFGENWRNPWTKNHMCTLTHTAGDRINNASKNLLGDESIPTANHALNPLQANGYLHLLRDSDQKVKAWLQKGDTCTSQKSSDDKPSLTSPNTPRPSHNAVPILSENARSDKSVSSLPTKLAEERHRFGTVGAAAIAHSKLQEMLTREKRSASCSIHATAGGNSIRDSLRDETHVNNRLRTENRTVDAKCIALTVSREKSFESHKVGEISQELHRSPAPRIHAIKRKAPEDCPRKVRSKHQSPSIEVGSGLLVRQNQDQMPTEGDVAPLSIKRDRPASSTFTSERGFSELPPSAQKQSGLPTSASILIEEKPIIPQPSYARATNDAVMDNNWSFSTSSKAQNHASKESKSNVSIGQVHGPMSQKMALEIAEEDNVRDVQGLDRSVSSTTDVQCVPAKPTESATRPAVTSSTMNPPAHRTQKRASFILDKDTERTHSSIKSVLKVGKRTILAPQKGPCLLDSEKRDSHEMISDTENHNCNGSTPTKVAKLSLDGIRAGSDNKPNGILKNSIGRSPRSVNANDLQRASKSIARSSSLMRDAQSPEQVHMVTAENDVNLIADVSDSFDLNNAIDDLGSFLCTWDTEKDASMMPSLT